MYFLFVSISQKRYMAKLNKLNLTKSILKIFFTVLDNRSITSERDLFRDSLDKQSSAREFNTCKLHRVWSDVCLQPALHNLAVKPIKQNIVVKSYE